MKNTEKEIGGWLIIEPQKVVTLAVIVPGGDYETIIKEWNRLEELFRETMPTFNRDDLFFEQNYDEKQYPSFCSIRYYTPESNRMKNVGH